MSSANWFLLLSLSVLWGGSFFFAKVAVAEIPPLTLALGRVAIAAAILGIVMRAIGILLPRDPSIWFALAGMGLLNNALPFTLIFWGQTHISSGLASILNATTPLFTVLVAHWATADDRLNLNRIFGLIIGFAGVIILIGPDLLFEIRTNIAAQIACLMGAFAYACAGVYGRRFRGQNPMLVAFGQLTTAATILLPIALIWDEPWTLAPSISAFGALFGLATISTALAYVLYFRILASAGATNLLLVTFLIPVTAILLGTFILGEQLAPGHFAGMAAIALGLAAIDGRVFKRVTIGRAA